MRAAPERYRYVLSSLVAMPFLDRLEMAALSAMPQRTVYDAVARLERLGLVDGVPHATPLQSRTRRFYLTAAGLNRLADVYGMSLDELLYLNPVSASWRRILLERLDTVGVIYRLVSAIARVADPIEIQWYRATPLDATVFLPGGRTIGVVRQGATSDRTAFAKRLWRLREGPLPSAVLMLAPDAVRLRHARRLMAGADLTTFLALEEDAALADAAAAVWRPPSIAAFLDMRYVLSHLGRGGALPEEPELSQASLPEDIDLDASGGDLPDHLLPPALRPTEKRMLDTLSDWPWISPLHLRRLLGFSGARLSQVMMPLLVGAGLVSRICTPAPRFVLTDRGLALLSRRDRTSVGTARRRWSAARLNPKAPADWRNVSGSRTRQLLRNLEHTEAVHGFIASLAAQCRAQGWEALQLDPARRASRYFQYGGRLHSVRPDAFGMVRHGPTIWPFFLEWERRAVRPVTMAARLAPYLRYFSSHRPIDDHGAQPAVLVVFAGDIAATHFLRVAQEEMERARVQLPLRVSHEAALEKLGPLGRAWRTPGAWQPTHAFTGH